MNTASPPQRRARRAAWEASLPTRVAALSARWGLGAVTPLGRGGTGARLYAAGPVVLKLSLPGQAVRAEADALAGFAGEGAARLLAQDDAEGALLIERLSPGTPLTTVADDAATRIAGALIARLRRPAPAGALLADAHGWVRILDRARAEAWPLPAPLGRAALDRAAALFRDLAASAPAPVLLHGDLHHGNILADDAAEWRRLNPRGVSGWRTVDPPSASGWRTADPPRATGWRAIDPHSATGWRAIDPRGASGDPAFEAAALLRNPPGAEAVARHAGRRIAILAETAGLDARRVASWGYAAALLAACWAIEDAEDASPWSMAAAALAPFAD